MSVHQNSVPRITIGASEIAALPLIDKGSKQVFLLPGDLHVAKEPSQISTILGSCVAVCLWDSALRLGGMNHFLLPASSNPEESTCRFGDHATTELLARMQRLGCKHRNLVAKLFGGSALFRQEQDYASSLGARNVETARILLLNAGVSIVAQDSGGRRGRKVVFDTGDGSVWARYV